MIWRDSSGSQSSSLTWLRISALLAAGVAVALLAILYWPRVDVDSVRRDLEIPSTSIIEVVQSGSRHSHPAGKVEFVWFVQTDLLDQPGGCRLVCAERRASDDSSKWQTPEICITWIEGQEGPYPFARYFDRDPSSDEVAQAIAQAEGYH